MNPEDWRRMRALYPSWNIRPTAGGRSLIATRLDRLHLTPDEMVAGLHMTVLEDSPEGLAAALTAQTEIEEAL